MKETRKMSSDLIVYQTEDGELHLNVQLENETVWLTQAAMAELFGCTSDNISLHLQNIYSSGELLEEATTEDFSVVRSEGVRQVSRKLKHYNLDAIIAIGYRVNSKRATQFRIWATQILKEYIVKGFALNDERMKTGRNMTYFDELQERIRKSVSRKKSSIRRSRISTRRASIMIPTMKRPSCSSRSSRTNCCGRSAVRPRRN